MWLSLILSRKRLQPLLSTAAPYRTRSSVLLSPFSRLSHLLLRLYSTCTLRPPGIVDMSISPDPEPEEEGHVATRLAGMTVHEFAQSPPEEGYSPTTQPDHSNTPTPTLPPVNLDMPDAFSSNQFGEHVTPALMGDRGGGAPFLYFAPGPPHAAPPSLHFQPPPSMPFTPTGFSPSSAISFNVDMPPPAPMLMPMAMPNEAFTAEGGYPTLQEPFHPMTPLSRGANLGDQGGERTGKAPVYRPPHLQRQYGPHGQQYSTASTLASPVSQGFPSYQGHDSASRGNYWSSQSSHRPPIHGQYGRRREVSTFSKSSRVIPLIAITSREGRPFFPDLARGH